MAGGQVVTDLGWREQAGSLHIDGYSHCNSGMSWFAVGLEVWQPRTGEGSCC
jgi:hypothetical protein